MPQHTTTHHATTQHTMPQHTITHHNTPCHNTPQHTMTKHIMPQHTPQHTIPYTTEHTQYNRTQQNPAQKSCDLLPSALFQPFLFSTSPCLHRKCCKPREEVTVSERGYVRLNRTPGRLNKHPGRLPYICQEVILDQRQI